MIRGLYERGMNAQDVGKLFRFIDWMIDLPEDLDESVVREILKIAEENSMPFITTPERVDLKAGYLKGIETVLDVKFGEAGLQLMPEIRQIHNHQMLESILDAIKNVDTPEDLRQLWLPK